MSKSVFLVDDDQAFLKVFSKKLENAGFKNVKKFTSGEDCLKNMKEKPEMILLDYMMEGMDGIQTLKAIKKRYTNIPVIFLSANDSKEVAEDALKHDAYDYIVKNDAAFGRIRLMMKQMRRHQIELDAKKKGRIYKYVFILIMVAFAATIFYLNFKYPGLFH